jgi:hypothetical protein
MLILKAIVFLLLVSLAIMSVGGEDAHGNLPRILHRSSGGKNRGGKGLFGSKSKGPTRIQHDTHVHPIVMVT